MDQLSELAKDTAFLKEQNIQQGVEIKFLHGQVKTLIKINNQSHNICMLFISKYKCNVLKKANKTNYKAINIGNIDTYKGNTQGMLCSTNYINSLTKAFT